MKRNKIILTICIFLMSINSNGQSKFNKRSTIDFSLDMKPVNHSLIFGDFYGIRNPIAQQFKTYHVEYKFAVSSKMSLGLIYNFGSYGVSGVKSENRSGSSFRNYLSELYIANSDGRTSNYGVSLNIYTKGFVAPIGNSISFFYKRNTSEISEIEYSFTRIDQNTNTVLDEGTKNKKFTFKANTIGISFNGLIFLSDKLPFYFNYSLGGGIMFGKEMKLGRNIFRLNNYDNRIVNSYRDWLSKGEILTFKVGVGYWF